MRKTNSDEQLVAQYGDQGIGLISRYLGIKNYQKKTVSHVFAPYKKTLVCKGLTEVIKGTEDIESYEERVSFDLDYYGRSIGASYEFLEVGRDNKEELLTSGYRFLLKDEIRLAVAVYQDYFGFVHLEISYAKKHTVNAILFLDATIKYMKTNNFYLNEKIDANGNFLTLENIGFDSLILPEKQKKAIKVGALDFFKKKELYAKNKIAFKRGIIMTGQPGTGKTHACKVLMNSSKSTFLWITADVLEKKGDIKHIFDMARELAPVILVIEDADDYLEKEGAVDVLKTQLDGMDAVSGIVTILCTNYPDRLPKSLIDRPSRFDDILIFELPDLELRLNLLNKFSELMSIENRDSIFKELAEKTKGLTGAHLKELVIYALLLASDEERETITEDDLVKAYLKVKNTKDIAINGLKDIDVKTLIKELGHIRKDIKKNNDKNK